MNALSPSEVEHALQDLPEWKVDNGKLMRAWTFSDFVQAMSFVNHIAEIAEAAGHHPDIDVRYSRVILGLVTHDAGGITEKDIAMARRLSESL